MLYTYHINIVTAFLIVGSVKKKTPPNNTDWMNQIWIVMVIISPPFTDSPLDARLCAKHHVSTQYSIHSAFHLCAFIYKQTAVQTHEIPNLKKWLSGQLEFGLTPSTLVGTGSFCSFRLFLHLTVYSVAVIGIRNGENWGKTCNCYKTLQISYFI